MEVQFEIRFVEGSMSHPPQSPLGQELLSVPCSVGRLTPILGSMLVPGSDGRLTPVMLGLMSVPGSNGRLTLKLGLVSVPGSDGRLTPVILGSSMSVLGSDSRLTPVILRLMSVPGSDNRLIQVILGLMSIPGRLTLVLFGMLNGTLLFGYYQIKHCLGNFPLLMPRWRKGNHYPHVYPSDYAIKS